MSDAETPTGKDERPVSEPLPVASAAQEKAEAPEAAPNPETAPTHEAAPAGRHGDTVAAALARGAAAAGGQARLDRCERVFRALSHAGPLFLLLILAAQVWPDFWHALKGNALYCPTEARNIEAWLLSMAQGVWLAPGVDGVALWPCFTWFLGLLQPLSQLLVGSPDLVLPLAGAIGAGLALIAVWSMARAAGFGAQSALAAGLLLLAAPLFAPLGHFIGPAALASALMVFSLLFFCRGWQAEHAWCSLPAAFVLAGMAGLAGGPFHLLLPLLASFFFLIWRGGFRRAQALDALLGFLLLLLLLGIWLIRIMLGNYDGGYLGQLFAGALHMPWPLAPRWWLVACLAVVGLVPWILAVFGVSWFRVLRDAPKSLSASRRSGGAALLWIALTLGLLLSPCLPAAQAQAAAVALACVAAPLLAKAILALPRLSAHLLYACVALLMLAAAIALLGARFELTQSALAGLSPVPLDEQILATLRGGWGLVALGGVCLLGTAIMTRFVRGDHGGGGLVAASVLSVLLTQPATLLLAPDLGKAPACGLKTFESIQKAAQAQLAPGGASVAPLPAPPAPEAAPAPPAPEAKPEAPAQPAPEAGPAAPQAPEAAPDRPGPEAKPEASATPPAPVAPQAGPEAGAPEAAPHAPEAAPAPPAPEAAAPEAAQPEAAKLEPAAPTAPPTPEPAPEARPAEAGPAPAPAAESPAPEEGGKP